MRRRSPSVVLLTAILGLVALGGLAAVFAATGPERAMNGDEAEAHPGRLARLPDGRRINLRCAGTGSPTVLLESGFAADSLAWGRVQPKIARTQRVCAYDRAGYGFSDEGPLPRDGAAVAADLDGALRAARIEGPFVMVGHSAGGLYVRLFADRRPRDVVGMVLVDSSVEFQEQRFNAMFGPGASSLAPLRNRAARCLEAAELLALPSAAEPLQVCTPKPSEKQSPAVFKARMAEAVRPGTWRTQISELDTLWAATSEEVAAGRRSMGDMPLIVLTADGTYAGAPERALPLLNSLWGDLHREVAARSTRGEQRLVAKSSHMMIFDQPDAIVAAVAEVSAAAKPARR